MHTSEHRHFISRPTKVWIAVDAALVALIIGLAAFGASADPDDSRPVCPGGQSVSWPMPALGGPTYYWEPRST